MLARDSRLTSADQFQRVVRHGRRVGSSSLVVHAAPGHDRVRAGFVVSKAVGNAVTRNQVQRRLRELVRARLQSIAPTDLVIRALPAAATASYESLGQDLDHCLGRVAS